MGWFTFCQNNSRGSTEGPAWFVCVEGANLEDIDRRAEAVGVYFDGCNTRRDCDCCGDRWSRSHGDLTDTPETYRATPGKLTGYFSERPILIVPLDKPEKGG